MYQKKTSTNKTRKLPLSQDAWLMFQFDNHEIIRLDLKPGESIEKHANNWRIIFFILEGEGSLIVGDEQFKLSKGESIAVESSLVRAWHNDSDGVLKLLVIKTLES